MQEDELDLDNIPAPVSVSYNAGPGIQIRGNPLDSPQEAGAELQQLTEMEGYIFGVIDLEDNRVIAYFTAGSTIGQSKLKQKPIVYLGLPVYEAISEVVIKGEPAGD